MKKGILFGIALVLIIGGAFGIHNFWQRTTPTRQETQMTPKRNRFRTAQMQFKKYGIRYLDYSNQLGTSTIKMRKQLKNHQLITVSGKEYRTLTAAYRAEKMALKANGTTDKEARNRARCEEAMKTMKVNLTPVDQKTYRNAQKFMKAMKTYRYQVGDPTGSYGQFMKQTGKSYHAADDAINRI
ncbi:hypothetical protein DCM90_04565 [Levilactobacillus bambusae]|uniref:Uncharacterized protein n=2 Tax=Levilactobacillus bambusae TaxID=2024736 RepID=A0A2V1MZG8_9LACO|nr:hypothetical protein DCM90_04565 [Levilactobacillus bambusae]